MPSSNSLIKDILEIINEGTDLKEEYILSSMFTQEAIADRLNISRSYLSMMIKDLKGASLIYPDLKHIQDKPKKMRVYFLTEAGSKELKKLKEKKALKVFEAHRPVVKQFFGRKHEMITFKDWLTDPFSRILVINGMAGIGKSSYVSKALSTARKDQPLFWFKLQEWSSLKPLLNRLSDFLSTTGRTAVASYLSDKDEPDITEVSLLLEKDLHTLQALLVFDDHQNIKDPVITRFFESLAEFLPRISSIKVVIIGRHLNRFYDINDLAMRKTVKEIKLEGLDEISSTHILRQKDIDFKDYKTLFRLTHGHPLALQIISDSTGLSRTESMLEYLEDQVFSKLSVEELTVLEIASVFRNSAKAATYLELAEINDRLTKGKRPNKGESSGIQDRKYEIKIITSLTNRSLIYPMGELYGVHDLIQSLCYATIPTTRMKKYHAIIGDHYLERLGNNENVLEAIHHLFLGGKVEETAQLAIDKGKDLIYGGYYNELMRTLEALPLKELDRPNKGQILLLMGELNIFKLELDKAFKDLQRSIKIFEKEGDPTGQAMAYHHIGEIMFKRTEYELALENYNHSKKYSVKAGYDAGVAEALLNVGKILRHQGKSKESRITHHTALEHALKVDDKHLLSKIYNGIAASHLDSGDHDKAAEVFKQSMELAEETGDTDQMCRVANNLGGMYYFSGNHEEAIKWYERSVQIAEKHGLIEMLVVSLSNLAEAYLESKQLEKALKTFERAIVPARKLQSKWILCNLYVTAGRVYMEMDDMVKSQIHFDTAMELIQETKPPPILNAQLHLYYGILLSRINEKDRALEMLNKSIATFKSIDNTEMMKKVNEEIKKIKGNDKKKKK